MLFAIAGISLLIATAVDIFYTVFTGRGGGWLTNVSTTSVWRVLLAIHRRHSIHRQLSIAGPLMLLSIVLLWYVLSVFGWTLIFASSDQAIIDSDKFPVISFTEKLYFVGVTFSTLGYGNLLPNGLPWTFLGNGTALTGTVLLTASLSYVLSVLQTSIERRQLASMINTVGTTPSAFVQRAWAGKDNGVLDSQLMSIANQVSTHAEKHVNYPILQYFHSGTWQKAPAPAVLIFSDALFMAKQGLHPDDRPAMSLIHLCEQSISSYLSQTSSSSSRLLPERRDSFGGDEGDIPQSLQLSRLSEIGLTTGSVLEYLKKFREYQSRREGLIRLAINDGWDPTCWPPDDDDADQPETEQMICSESVHEDASC